MNFMDLYNLQIWLMLESHEVEVVNPDAILERGCVSQLRLNHTAVTNDP